jgi:hypothetical protein
MRFVTRRSFYRQVGKDRQCGNPTAATALPTRGGYMMADAHALKRIGLLLAIVTFAVTSMAGIIVSGHLDGTPVEYQSSQ